MVYIYDDTANENLNISIVALQLKCELDIHKMTLQINPTRIMQLCDHVRNRKISCITRNVGLLCIAHRSNWGV